TAPSHHRSAPRGPSFRAREVCADNPSGMLAEDLWHRVRRDRLEELLVDHHRRREPAGAETFDFDNGVAAIRRGGAQLAASGALEEGLDDLLRAAHAARRRRAHLDEILPHRM